MKTIITCAITGAVTKPDQTPYLPITPDQIANSGLEAAEAGAAILHIHVRDPNTGLPSMSTDLYEETVNLIKKQNKDVLINLTTGPGAVYVPDPSDISKPGPMTRLFGAERRVEHIRKIKPDICSIDFNTMHQSNGGIRINHKKVVSKMIDIVQTVGTKPELELFDSGDFVLAKELYDENIIKGNPFWQLAMGIKYGWPASIDSFQFARKLLPENCNWSAFGIGRMEMQYVALAHMAGGHVRVGMEDNIYLEKGILAESNAQLVQKAVDIIRNLGGSVASPTDARQILFDV